MYRPLRHRLLDSLRTTWYLGFTSFGGVAAHLEVFRRTFVDCPNPWIDDETYGQLFALTQILPGPASTKMGICIVLARDGFIPAMVFFATWSLPGALGMIGLAMGVSRISATLPGPVYPLLSGLNAATVGIIAYAGVQLSRKAITGPLTRLLVIGSGCAGICYTALWYFPVILIIDGVITLSWALWYGSAARIEIIERCRRCLYGDAVVSRGPEESAQESGLPATIPMQGSKVASGNSPHRSSRLVAPTRISLEHVHCVTTNSIGSFGIGDQGADLQASPQSPILPTMSVKASIALVVAFFVSLISIMVVDAKLNDAPLALKLFRNMYLAGTVIFGGGPVVVPLLREYVVQPGFVTPRDFLIGLALIQAFPGPNFNLAVYLGILTFAQTNTPSILGGILGFIGINAPGILLVIAFLPLWHILRTRPTLIAFLRGVNAGAVGLIFTAVYRIWKIGYLKEGHTSGASLGDDPWWGVVAIIAYASLEWYKVCTFLPIVGGSVLGLCWYGVTKR